MKNLFLSILMITPLVGIAQPSNSSVTALIRKNHPKAKTIKLGGETRTKEIVNGVWVYYYNRSYVATFVTEELPEITMIFNGSVQYVVNGSTYSFKTFWIGTTEFDGVPNPNEEEVSTLLNTNLQDYLRFEYNDIVGDISPITIPNDVKYNWDDLNHVTFETVVTYTRKISNTKLETATHTYETHFYRDGYNQPWKSFQAFETEEKRKVISTKTVSLSEMENYKTLSEINENREADNMFSSLPNVSELPIFKTDKQLFYFVHNVLMTKDSQEVKAYLFKLIDKNYFEDKHVLNERTKDWVDNIVNNINSYQKIFCEYPKIKDEQVGMIYFYNKELSKYVRMTGVEGNGTWKLTLIDFYPPAKEDIDRLANISGNCGEKPDLEVKEVIKYKIGDKVDVEFSNGIFQGEIVKKDQSFDNRYFVKVSNGRSYWLTDDKLSPSTASSNITTNETTQSESNVKPQSEKKATFVVGDKVKVKTTSGDMKGKIIKATNGKFLIKLADPRYQDMWVNPSNLIKL